MKKYSICDILVKQLAHNFRQLYPNLRIEGHPSRSEEYRLHPRIIITNKNRDFRLQFIFGQNLANNDVITVFVRAQPNIYQHGLLSSISTRPYSHRHHTIELPNPNSIDNLEQWMAKHIEYNQQK
jgi:hypothetical protein